MSFLHRIFAKEKSYGGVPSTMTSAGSISGGALNLAASTSATGVLVSQGTAMSVSSVHDAVTHLAQDLARCTPSLVRRKKDGSYDKVTNHPVAKLLMRPNDQQTWFEFAEMMEAQRRLRGNAYAVIIRGERETPIKLIPVNSDFVQVLESAEGFVFYSVGRYGLWLMHELQSKDMMVPQHDMLHIRGLSFNALAGSSPLAFAKDTVGLALAQEQQGANWLKNGARPSIILKTAKKLTRETAQRLKDSWDKFKSGIMNTGSTVILEEGIEPQVLAMNSSDLQYQQQRSFSVSEISRFFDYPLWKLQDTDALKSLDLQRAQQDYVNRCIAPALDRWEQRLAFTFGLYDVEVYFDDSRLLRADYATRVENGRKAALAGLITVNEWRRPERLCDQPGGDELRAPVNMAALGSDVSGSGADGGGRPSGGNDPTPTGV